MSKTREVKEVKAETRNAEMLHLEAKRRDLRRRQFEARINELGLRVESVITLDKLFQQQEILQQLETTQVMSGNSVSSKKCKKFL